MRAQFRFYLICLLRTSLESRDKPVMHHFNSQFYSALDSTHWYRSWVRNPPQQLVCIPPGSYKKSNMSQGYIFYKIIRIRMESNRTQNVFRTAKQSPPALYSLKSTSCTAPFHSSSSSSIVI